MQNTSFEQLKQSVLGAEEDFNKFYNQGNKAAGTRLRRHMQTAKKIAQEIRVDVTNVKNSAQ